MVERMPSVMLTFSDSAPFNCCQVGELRVRGYAVMRGYWGDEGSTAAAIDEVGARPPSRHILRSGVVVLSGRLPTADCLSGTHVQSGGNLAFCSVMPRLRFRRRREPCWTCPTLLRCTQQDGWMHTGDLASIDAEGYCSVVGRIRDVVIRGG